MKQKILFLITFLFLLPMLHAQTISDYARGLVASPYLPRVCNPVLGTMIYYIGSAHQGAGLYACTDTNTWTRLETPYIFSVKAFGAAADGVTDDSVNFQNAVTAAVNAAAAISAKVRLVADGQFRINSIINLGSNVIYDFTQATFYPDAGLAGNYIFFANGITDFEIYGGRYLQAAFSPTTVLGTGTYIDGSVVYATGCSNFKISGLYSTPWFGVVNVYNSSNGWIDHLYSYNDNAVISVVAEGGTGISNIHISKNKIIGCGDDAIGVLSRIDSFDAEHVFITDNYVDKTRLAVASAVGVRVGRYAAGTGELRHIQIINNQFYNMTDHVIFTHDLKHSVIALNNTDGYATSTQTAAFGLGTTALPAQYLKIIGNIVRNPAANAIGLGGCILDSEIANNHMESDFNSVGTIYLEDSLRNNIHDNFLVNNDAGNDPRIQTIGASDYNDVRQNDVSESLAGTPVSIVGANNRIERNRGWMSENGGTSAAIATGGTIAHGLNGTPVNYQVTATDGALDVSVTADATNLTVTFGGGGNKIFSWHARLAYSY